MHCLDGVTRLLGWGLLWSVVRHVPDYQFCVYDKSRAVSGADELTRGFSMCVCASVCVVWVAFHFMFKSRLMKWWASAVLIFAINYGIQATTTLALFSENTKKFSICQRALVVSPRLIHGISSLLWSTSTILWHFLMSLERTRATVSWGGPVATSWIEKKKENTDEFSRLEVSFHDQMHRLAFEHLNRMNEEPYSNLTPNIREHSSTLTRVCY